MDPENGFRPILCICVCITIDAMLNFDGDIDLNANADVQCENTLTSIQSIYMIEKIERQDLVYLGRQYVNSAMRCLNPEVHFFPVIVNHLV